MGHIGRVPAMPRPAALFRPCLWGARQAVTNLNLDRTMNFAMTFRQCASWAASSRYPGQCNEQFDIFLAMRRRNADGGRTRCRQASAPLPRLQMPRPFHPYPDAFRHAAGKIEQPVCIQPPNIASVKPQIALCLQCFLRHTEIAVSHDPGFARANDHFTALFGRQRIVMLIHDGHFIMRQNNAAVMTPLRDNPTRIGRRNRHRAKDATRNACQNLPEQAQASPRRVTRCCLSSGTEVRRITAAVPSQGT